MFHTMKDHVGKGSALEMEGKVEVDRNPGPLRCRS